jgi:AcrR family transcriptional regulator
MGIAERKQREHERKEALILDAAERVFAVKGFLAATVEDVAHESEYSVGTLYNTIGNKESILASLVLRILSEIYAQRPPISTVEKVVPQLERVFRFYIDFWFSHRDYVRIIRSFDSPDTQLRVKPDLFAQVKSTQYSLLNPMLDLVKAGQESGEIRTDASPVELSFIFFGFLHSFVQSIDVPQTSELEEKFGFDIKHLVHQGIMMLLDSLTVTERGARAIE